MSEIHDPFAIEGAAEFKIGTVEDILAAADLREEVMPIPEWGFAIRVRGLTKQEQLDIRREAKRGAEIDDAVMEMLMFITGVSEPKFEKRHYGQLVGKSSGVVDRILKRIATLSGATEEEASAARSSFRD